MKFPTRPWDRYPSTDERFAADQAIADRLLLRTAIIDVTRPPGTPEHIRRPLLDALERTRLPR